MRAIRLLPFAFLFCAACSPDPTGLYKNQSGSMSFDFRSDKTARFTHILYPGCSRGVETQRHEDKGEWSIEGGKLLFEGIVRTIHISGIPHTTITNTNDRTRVEFSYDRTRIEFSFESNGDLMVPGESYEEGIRFIKQ